VVVDGKFVPSAVVTVIADDKLTADSMIEMQAGVFAAFRCVSVCGVSVFVWCVCVCLSVCVCVCVVPET
jgi:hypothetical protein